MTTARRNAVFAVLVLFIVVAAWRVFGQMQAERYAATDPERALQWRPNNPTALQVLAERHLQAGDGAGAARLARAAATEAERAAAQDQVVRILRSLALYYLPDPDRLPLALTRGPATPRPAA